MGQVGPLLTPSILSTQTSNSYSQPQLLCSTGNQVQIISKAVQGRHLKMANILQNSIFQQFISIKYAQGSILVENGFCFANVMIHIMIICAFIQSQQKNNVILHIWPNTTNQYRLNKKWDTHRGGLFSFLFFPPIQSVELHNSGIKHWPG